MIDEFKLYDEALQKDAIEDLAKKCDFSKYCKWRIFGFLFRLRRISFYLLQIFIREGGSPDSNNSKASHFVRIIYTVQIEFGKNFDDYTKRETI